MPPQYVDQRDLVRGLSEKEVEIEHLRTTIVALNEKAEVLEDMRKDVFAQKELLRSSETHRFELQAQLTETARKLDEDTAQHQQYQQRLIADNERLRQELEAARQLLAKREQEHLLKLDEVQRNNQLRMDALAQLHHDTQTSSNNAHQAKME